MLLAIGVLPGAAFGAGIDRPMKLELIDQRDARPATLWLGSSTSREADPAQLARITGGAAFNAAVSAGRPVEEHFFAQEFTTRFPGGLPHLVIALDVEQFRRERADPIVRRPAGSLPLPSKRYRADGFRTINPYAGRVLTRHLAPSIREYQRLIYPKLRRLDPAQVAQLRGLLALASQHGGVPTVLIMPAHPRHVRELRPFGRAKRRHELLGLLETLRAEGLPFRLADYGAIAAFGGRAGDFYDGVHMNPRNMARMVARLGMAGYLAPPLLAPLPVPLEPAAVS